MVAKHKPGRNAILDEYRPAGALLTLQTAKTVKGEALGWASAVMYLQPHTLVSRKSLCPHSTPACRAGCLATAGMMDLQRQTTARTNRTRLLLDDRAGFMAKLAMEIYDLIEIAGDAGVSLAVRLNGTSDILWEKELTPAGKTLFDLFPSTQFYDYTKIPLEHRALPSNYHLTFSLDEENFDKAAIYLASGYSVAAVVPEEAKLEDGGWFAFGSSQIFVVDGDLHDLRFLDAPGSLVQLKPKGNYVGKTELIQHDLVRRFMAAGREISERISA